MMFGGACIDGPLMGRNYVNDHPFFYIDVMPRMGAIHPPLKPEDPVEPTYSRHAYRWDSNLHVWRFET
jgi:hypothetical protein